MQSFKDVRARALDVVEEIGSEVVKLGETLGTQETRKTFVDSCADLKAFPAVRSCPLRRLLHADHFIAHARAHSRPRKECDGRSQEARRWLWKGLQESRQGP